MASVSLKSFASGELSPRMGARSDVVKYQTGLKTMRNWFVTREGAAMNRGGLEFICPRLGFSSGTMRQIGFVFNNSQAYDLILQDSKLFFILDGFPITEATRAITAITRATPPVVTSNAHGYANDDMVYVESVAGMAELNARFFKVANVTANTYELHEEAAVVGAAYTAYTSGGTARRIYALGTSFTAATLPGIRFAQSGDVLTLTHNLVGVYDLIRVSDTNWSLSAKSFDPTISRPEGGALAGTAGAVTTRYRVTALASDTLEESLPGLSPRQNCSINTNVTPMVVTKAAHGYDTGDEIFITYNVGVPVAVAGLTGTIWTITVTGVNAFTLDASTALGLGAAINSQDMARTSIVTKVLTAPATANPITITWTAVTGALQYNIYREINGIYGYIGTAATASFQDLGYTLDPQDTPPIHYGGFVVAGDRPRAINYYQQRLVLGGSDNDPESTRVSRTGLYYNFTQSSPIQADDSFSFTVASNQVNAVQHYVEMDRLFIFTQGAEFTIEGDDAGTLTPTAINARKRSENGISDVRPLVISQAILYIQTGARQPSETDYGNVILEVSSGQNFGSFDTADLTVFSSHLFEGRSVVDWAYAKRPFNIVWAVRDDGALLGLTYLKSQNVLGWHRHDTGAGDDFKTVCAIPEGSETAVYATVERLNCNGHTTARSYVERMSSRILLSLDEARILDSFRTYDSYTVINAAPADIYTLTETATDIWTVTAAGTLTFTVGDLSPDIGKLIAFHLTDGRRIRVRVTSVIDTTHAYVDVAIDTLVIDELVDAGTITVPYASYLWSIGSLTIRGMWHLEGRTVYALVDGNDEGPYTVALGAVTLANAGSLVHIGLQIVADLETLPPDDPNSATLTDKAKTVAKITLQLEKAVGLKVGVDLDHLNPWTTKNLKTPAGSIPTGRLYTGTLIVPNSAKTDYFGSVAVRMDRPLPACTLCIVPTLTAGGA